MKQFKKNRGILMFCLIVMVMFVPDVMAVTVSGGEQGIFGDLYGFLNEKLRTEAMTVAGVVLFLVTAIAALGQSIGKFIMNNLGYVAYLGFGGTAIAGALHASGLII